MYTSFYRPYKGLKLQYLINNATPLKSFYRPYKGLKQNLIWKLYERFSTVFIVPTRGWNTFLSLTVSIWQQSFYRPYKGLKQKEVEEKEEGKISFYRPYKGLKLTIPFIISFKFFIVFIVPTRGWNFKSW